MTEIPSYAGVNVFCMSPTHESKPALVAFMFRKDDTGEWSPRADNMGEKLSILDGDDLLDQDKGLMLKQHAWMRKPTTRRHVEMTCPLCGFKLSAKAERLDEVLDDFWMKGSAAGLVVNAHGSALGGGVLPVPLATLAANV